MCSPMRGEVKKPYLNFKWQSQREGAFHCWNSFIASEGRSLNLRVPTIIDFSNLLWLLCNTGCSSFSTMNQHGEFTACGYK